MAASPPGLMFKSVSSKTLKVYFSTKLGVPIHLVILLRSPEFKEVHLYQGQGQITLKTSLHILLLVRFSLLANWIGPMQYSETSLSV